MIKGNANGFDFEIDEKILDDWELLEKIRAVDKGDAGMCIDVALAFLGEEQYEALKNHIRSENGKVTITAMRDALDCIFSACDETKN